MSAFDRQQAATIVQSESKVMLAHARSIKPFQINGFTYGGEQIVPLLVIDPACLDVHMAQVAGWIGYWGVLTAAAKRDHDRHQAQYRVARDSFIASVGSSEDGEDPKPKAKAKSKTKTAAETEWRTLPGYDSLYEKGADLEYAWSCAQFVYEALLRKATMLTALGKVYADERSAPTATPSSAR